MDLKIKKLNTSIQLFLDIIDDIKHQIDYLNAYEETCLKEMERKRNQRNLDNERIEKRLKLKEIEYDKFYELYMRNKIIVEKKILITDLVRNIITDFSQIIEPYHNKSDYYGNKLVRMENDIKIIEQEIEEQNEQRRKQRIRERNIFLENYLTVDEMDMIEKTTGRYFDKILFDSNTMNWSIRNSAFHTKILNKSNIVIIIETTERI